MKAEKRHYAKASLVLQSLQPPQSLALLLLAAETTVPVTVTFPPAILVAPGEFVLDASPPLPRNLTVDSAVCI